MNTFSIQPRFWRSLTLFAYCLVAILLFTGCKLPTNGPETNKSTIQITVWDDQTQRPVKRAEVFLKLPQQIYPVQYTDDVGRVIFQVDNDLLHGVSELVIQKVGYQTQNHNVTLANAPLFQTYLVRTGATPVPRETPSVTPNPPTPRPDDTATPVPIATEVPTNIPTATPTNTPSPEPLTDEVTLTRRDGANTVFILAGPDEINAQLGTLAVNETAVVIGRTAENEWLKIVNDRGIEGWVANCEVVLSSTNLSSIPMVWPGPVTAKNCGDGTSLPPPPCVTISLARTVWPSREFDDIMLSWTNVPAAATRLELWVTGPKNSGETDYVIHPTFSDVNVPYKVELFKFEDGNFLPGATYTYVVRPYDVVNNIICTTQGTFVP